MFGHSLVPSTPARGEEPAISMEEAIKFSTLVAQSKLFGCENAAQAFVKIMAGAEMGFGPIASMASVHIIEGKPSPGADLIAAAIRRRGSGYDYEILEISDKACAIAFYRIVKDGSRQEVKGSPLRYTMEEAHHKGWDVTSKGSAKGTWIQKPANMLFARTITDGKRFFCPDVLTSVFDRDEIDSQSFAQVNPATRTNNPNNIETSATFHTSEGLAVASSGELDAIEVIHGRIESLVKDVGVTPEQMRKRLERSGVANVSIREIADIDLLETLERELTTAKSKLAKPQVPTASKADRKE